MASLDFLDATDNIVRGAAQYLVAERPKGWADGLLPRWCRDHSGCGAAEGNCGGLLLLWHSAQKRRLTPACISIPFQGHFSNTDDWCTPALVDELEARFKETRREGRNLPLRR